MNVYYIRLPLVKGPGKKDWKMKQEGGSVHLDR
jgi:hypothetical protein